MKFSIVKCLELSLVGKTLFLPAQITAQREFPWTTVVNNNDLIPEILPDDRTFNSYNPPSVSSRGVIVFRGRSTGRAQGPVSGIFKRSFRGLTPISAIQKVAARSVPNQESSTTVPDPNNLLSRFIEFPAFPRISINTGVIATRGNHQPVWKWTVDEEDERAGTTGVYVELDDLLFTGASLLGAVPDEDFASFYDVPFADNRNSGIRFGVFPGAPSITDDNIVAFKGNFEENGVSKTGVFFRQLTADQTYGGNEEVQFVASSNTIIPNPGNKCSSGTTFGSTAPPTAAGNTMIFVGSDNEDNPSCGGIYRASLEPNPVLEVMISLGETLVPGLGNEPLTRLGEGLAYDGAVIAFWAAWGTETKTVRVFCPTTGNQARRDYCNQVSSDGGDPDSICVSDDGPCYQEKEVPLNQGIFLYSGRGRLQLIADTVTDFDDFVFWNYSGAPPGAGSGDADREPPRFRSSAFIAVSGPKVAFKARTGDLDENNNIYVNPIDGIYLKVTGSPVFTVAETRMLGTIFDPEAVFPDDTPIDVAGTPLVVDEIAIERESLRGSNLAITVGFTGLYTDEEGELVDVEFAGIYITRA